MELMWIWKADRGSNTRNMVNEESRTFFQKNKFNIPFAMHHIHRSRFTGLSIEKNFIFK
jgi:hypothetical protein